MWFVLLATLLLGNYAFHHLVDAERLSRRDQCKSNKMFFHLPCRCNASMAFASERLLRSLARLVGGPARAGVTRWSAHEGQERPPPTPSPPWRAPRQTPPHSPQAWRGAARRSGRRPPAQTRAGARRAAQGRAQAPQEAHRARTPLGAPPPAGLKV
jgi:hypothetical protein